ncbi:unnamed protein product, partial [Staurois parvus]
MNRPVACPECGCLWCPWVLGPSLPVVSPCAGAGLRSWSPFGSLGPLPRGRLSACCPRL